MSGHDQPVNGTAVALAELQQAPDFAIDVTPDQGRVRVDFNRQVAWFAMQPTEAIAFAQQVLQMSCALTGLSLTIKVGDEQAGP